MVRYSTPTVPPPSNPSQPPQQNLSHHPSAQANIINPEAHVALPPPNIPTNHNAPPPPAAHIVGHPQHGIPPQIQVHYPTIFQATIMAQQGHHQGDQGDQQQVPDQQHVHQQVYHYQQDFQVQPKTQEPLIDDDASCPTGKPTIAQTAVSCFH